MQNNWPTKKLGEVAYFQEGPGLRTFQFKPSGIRVINVANVQDGFLDLIETKYLDPKEIKEKYQHFLVNEGDILLSTSGTIGRVARVRKEDLPLMLNTSVMRLRSLNENTLLNQFLFYFLNTESFKKTLLSYKTGVAIFNVGPSHLKRIWLTLPPLPIQHQIVERLDAIKKVQELNDKQIALANEFFQSLSYKELNSKIKDWKNINFGEKEIMEIIDGDRGKNYPKKNEFKKSGYCVFLNTKNVTANGFVFNVIDFISKERDEKLRKGRLQRNDVVLTTRGTVGNSALYGESVEFNNIRINSGMVIIRSNTQKIIPKFLLNLIQNNLVQDKFKQILSGSAQPQLPICNLVKIKFPLPPLGIQRQIAGKLQVVQDYKKKLSEQKQKLQELFLSCLDKAMRGELVN